MVPFGLTNVPATFTCLVNSVLSKYLDKFVLVFLNDILVYSKHEEKCKVCMVCKCEASFQQLKKLLTSAPILNIIDPKKDFMVCTDACI